MINMNAGGEILVISDVFRDGADCQWAGQVFPDFEKQQIVIAKDILPRNFSAIPKVLKKNKLEYRLPRFLARKGRELRTKATSGRVLLQEVFYVGNFDGVGRIYMHVVVDPFRSFAFVFLHTSKAPEWAAAVVHYDVLPFYRKKGLTVQAILTDNGTEFCGKTTHPYELYLAINNIEHRKTEVRTPKVNTFMERVQHTVMSDFFGRVCRENHHDTIEALQDSLNLWLDRYNYKQARLGCLKCGKSPRQR